jgi:hypothetical protein
MQIEITEVERRLFIRSLVTRIKFLQHRVSDEIGDTEEYRKEIGRLVKLRQRLVELMTK